MSILKYFQKAGETSSTATVDHDGSSPLAQSSSEHTEIPVGGEQGSFSGDTSDDSSPPQAAVTSCVLGAGSGDPGDVAAYIGDSARISDDRKYQLLVKHFKPCPDYKFPKGAYGRTFQYQWLQHFQWLVYSKQENGGFCLPCVLFATFGYNQSTLGVLVRRPLTAFSKALELFRKHAASNHHQTAVVRADEFLKVMRNFQPDIRHQVSQAIANQVCTNRKILSSIMKTIVLCGQQNFALPMN